MSGWKIIGVTDESTQCEICGRTELKNTTLIEFEDGSKIYAGSSCAARRVGVSASDMRGAIKAYRMRLEVARCNFPDYFRQRWGTTVEQFLRDNPQRRKVAETRYRIYMLREGFIV